MRTLFLLVVPVAALTSMACGGTGDTASSGTGTGAGGSGGSASTTASSGSSSSTSTSTGGDATTSSSSGTGGGSACAGYIDVFESGEQQHFDSICKGSWGSDQSTTAIGYHFAGGAAPGADEMEIVGCTGGNSPAGLQLSTAKANGPGTFLDGAATYTDSSGVSWSSTADPYKVVFTKVDPPGGVMEGTFAVTVTGPTDAKKSLTGSFHVCRVADENVP